MYFVRIVSVAVVVGSVFYIAIVVVVVNTRAHIFSIYDHICVLDSFQNTTCIFICSIVVVVVVVDVVYIVVVNAVFVVVVVITLTNVFCMHYHIHIYICK